MHPEGSVTPRAVELSAGNPQTGPLCAPQPRFRGQERLQLALADAEPFPYRSPVGSWAHKYLSTKRYKEFAAEAALHGLSGRWQRRLRGRRGNYFKLPGCQRAAPAQPRSEDAGDAIRGVHPPPAELLGLLHRPKRPGEAGRITHRGGDLPAPGQLFLPQIGVSLLVIPTAASGRSPPSAAWLVLLCSLTYFLPLSLPSVASLAAKTPQNLSQIRSGARRDPRGGHGGAPHRTFRRSSSPCRGARALQILPVSIEEGQHSSARKALPLLLLLESSGCSNPITAHRGCPRDQQEFLALLTAREQIHFHLAKWALGS